MRRGGFDVGARLLAAGIAMAAVVPGVGPTGCASVAVPPPAVAPGHPEFVYPAVPQALGKGDLAARQQRGWQFLQAGDLRAARREFSAALRKRATFYPAEAGLGYVSLAIPDFADAVARFDRVLRQAPGYVPALVGRGDALVGLERVADAVASFRAALDADPALVEVRRRLDVLALRAQQESLTAARREAEAGHYDRAAAAYRRALADSPDSAFLYRELAAVERRQGDPAGAMEDLRKAIALDASDARAHVLMGELLEDEGDFAGAVSAYALAQSLEPGDEAASRVARARARAELAALPAEYRAIPAAGQVSRGDLAAVIGVRLAPLLAAARPHDAAVATDVRSHWAAAWIMAVVRAGVMEPYPNHTFQPRAVVRRLDLAQVAARVLNVVAARRRDLGSTWAAARPRMPDLPASHLGYPAVAMVVAAGVMPLVDGSFRPARPVSGAEVMETVARLEELAR